MQYIGLKNEGEDLVNRYDLNSINTEIQSLKNVVNQSPSVYTSKNSTIISFYLPAGSIVPNKRYIVRLVGFFDYPAGVKPPADNTKIINYTLTKANGTRGMDSWDTNPSRRNLAYNPATKMGIIHLDMKGVALSSGSLYMRFDLPSDAPRAMELTETTF